MNRSESHVASAVMLARVLPLLSRKKVLEAIHDGLLAHKHTTTRANGYQQNTSTLRAIRSDVGAVTAINGISQENLIYLGGC